MSSLIQWHIQWQIYNKSVYIISVSSVLIMCLGTAKHIKNGPSAPTGDIADQRIM